MSDQDHNLMAVLYAAVTAVEEGKVAEMEVEHRTVRGDDEVVLVVSVRRDVKHFNPPSVTPPS